MVLSAPVWSCKIVRKVLLQKLPSDCCCFLHVASVFIGLLLLPNDYCSFLKIRMLDVTSFRFLLLPSDYSYFHVDVITFSRIAIAFSDLLLLPSDLYSYFRTLLLLPDYCYFNELRPSNDD